MMELGGLPLIGAAAVAVDPCILSEALVRIQWSGIGRDRPQEYPELFSKSISTFVKFT